MSLIYLVCLNVSEEEILYCAPQESIRAFGSPSLLLALLASPGEMDALGRMVSVRDLIVLLYLNNFSLSSLATTPGLHVLRSLITFLSA